MSKQPRVSNHFAKTGNIVRDSALGLVTETIEPYLRFNHAIWHNGPLTAADIELARLRNARQVNCVFCKAVRYDIAIEAGLDEAKVEQITDDFDQSELSPREKLILAYTDHYLQQPTAMTTEFKQRLTEEFSAAEIVHLSLAIMLCNCFSRCAVSLGGMPEEDLPRMQISVPE
jgi:alkylhydroperoxidase family enzyme